MKSLEFIREGIWDTIKSGAQNLFNNVKRIIFRITFGQKVEINLRDYLNLRPLPLTEADKNREVFDLTSMIGYYNEYAVAWKLAFGLEHNGVNVKSNAVRGLRQHCEDYLQYILDNINKFREGPETVQRELKRAEDGSEVMAKKMWDEIVDAYDLKLIDVVIDLTGKEAQGLGKEDIKITIRKRDSEEVADMIKASLKLYKTPSGVNVYNATFASYLLTVITGKDSEATGKKAIKEFLDDHPQFADGIREVTEITDQWKKIKTRLKREKNPDYRKAANEFISQHRGYQKMRDLLFRKIWVYFYAQNKEKMNERMLHRLGLDGADDVYLLVGTEKQRMVAVSSRTSPEFKRLYDNLKAGFNIRFSLPEDPEVVNCSMIIDSQEGEELARFTINFKEGSTFPHMWNMGSIVRGEKARQG
jgi:hypothetical protein